MPFSSQSPKRTGSRPSGSVFGRSTDSGVGTGVFGGMLTATVLAIFFIPLFYVAVRKLSGVPLNGKKKDKE